MNEEQAEAYRNDLDLTRVSHLYELARGRRKEVADLALLGLKTLILLNGGAIVALFTVLAHFDQLTVVGWRLWVAFGVFCSGAVFALTSLLLGFLSSNSNWYAEQADANFIYFHSRGENETASKLKAQREKAMKSGPKLWISAATLSAVSILAFAVGSGFALWAVKLKPADAATAAPSTARLDLARPAASPRSAGISTGR
jgi:hypothetical protein